MKKVLGTPFEISLRILILLSEAKKRILTVDKIATIDFMAIYARDFNLSNINLHGDSVYRFGEFATRRELVRESVKRLVLDGMVFVKMDINTQLSLNNAGLICLDNTDNTSFEPDDQKCFEYLLSDVGKKFVANFKSDYAIAYGKIVACTIEAMASKSEFDLYEIISKRTILSLQGEQVNG